MLIKLTNEIYSVEHVNNGTICFYGKSNIIARLEGYQLEYGSIHNLRSPIASDDGWLTLDHIDGLQVGEEIEIRNEYQLARANLPIVHNCTVDVVEGFRVKVSPPVPKVPPLRSQQGIFLLRRNSVKIQNFVSCTVQNDAHRTQMRLRGKGESVSLKLSLSIFVGSPEVKIEVTRRYLKNIQVLSESITFCELPSLMEVYRKNRQIHNQWFQQCYNLDRQGACFMDKNSNEGIYIYGKTTATSIDLKRTDIRFDLQEITPFRSSPHSLSAATENNLLNYASARAVDNTVMFELSLEKPANIWGLNLTWYRIPPLSMVVEAWDADGNLLKVADMPCNENNIYLFEQPIKSENFRLSFITPVSPEDNLLIQLIDLLVDGENFTLRYNLDDYRDHRYCRYLDPDRRRTEMGEMVMEMRSVTSRTRGEVASQYCCLHIGSIPPIRPRVMHIPNGYEALLLWTEHADRASLESHRAVYFGRSDISKADEAVGGFVYHCIPVTKSVFWSNPSGQPCSTSHRVPQVALADNDDFKILCQDLAKLGYEICVHAPHPKNGTPEAGPETARQFAKLFGSTTWIDHSSRIVHYGLSGQGLNQKSPYYMKNAWEETGFHYFWQFASEDAGEQRTGSINIQQHRLGDWLHTPLFWQHPSETENFISWPSLRGGDLDIYTEEEIEALINAWGVCINHTYPPANYDNPSRSQYLAGQEDGLLTTSSLFEKVLGSFSQNIARGRIKAMCVSEAIKFWQAIDRVEIEHIQDREICIFNHSGQDIEGFTLVINSNSFCDKLDIQNAVLKQIANDLFITFLLKAKAYVRLYYDGTKNTLNLSQNHYLADLQYTSNNFLRGMKMSQTSSDSAHSVQIIVPDNHPMIDPEHKLIFYWTPRCASTTLLIWFFHLIGWQDRLRTQSAHQTRAEWVKKNYGLISDEKLVYNDPSFRRYAIVRNPYTRAISSWYLILVSSKQWNANKQKLPNVYDNRRLTIREFFDFLDTEDLETCNIHWRLQTANGWWTNKAPDVNLIRTDKLNEFLESLNKEFSLKCQIKQASSTPKYEGSIEEIDIFNMTRDDFMQVMGNDSKSGKMKFPDTSAFLSDEIICRIENLYLRDIKVFGFDRGHQGLLVSSQAGLASQQSESTLIEQKKKASLSFSACVICGTSIDQFEMFKGKPRRCPSCGSSERQRSFAYAQISGMLQEVGVELTNKEMLLISPSSSERRFLKTIPDIRITTIDIRPQVKPDIIANICDMPSVKKASFDVIYASCVLNCVYNLDACLKELQRVLKPDGGIFLSLEILDTGKNTVEFTDINVITKWYGMEAYEKYRIGAYRRFGEQDYADILSRYFRAEIIKVMDHPSGNEQRWHICTPREWHGN